MPLVPSALRYSIIESRDQALLIARIKEILLEGDSHGAAHFDATYWHWKYAETAGQQALPYVVWQGDTIVGYYHVIVYRGLYAGQPKRIAMIQDVAVSNVMRGQGVFRQLADYVHQDLARQDVDFCYTFPNQKSIHTFLKYNGYKQVCTYTTYVSPTNTAALIKSKISMPWIDQLLGWPIDLLLSWMGNDQLDEDEVVAYAQPTPAFAAPFVEQATRFEGACLAKDERYLQWRYAAKPNAQHYYLSRTHQGVVQASMVLKHDILFGNPALVVMELAGDRRAVRDLLCEVKRGSKHIPEPYNLVFVAAHAQLAASLGGLGFLPVHQRMNPRPLHMLVRNYQLTAGARLLDPQNWQATLGDWDVL